VVALLAAGGYLLAAAGALALRTLLFGRWHDGETRARGDSALLPMSARLFFTWALWPLWLLARWTRLPAVGFTLLGALLAMGSGMAVASGALALGGWLYLFAGVCDVLDGRVARALGTAGAHGAAIDSVLDRYADAAVMVGVAWHLRGGWPLALALAVLVGSMLVSYVRARGEGLGVEVRVGLMQRPERVVLIGAALALGPVVAHVSEGALAADHVVVAALALVAATTHVTALHRLTHVLAALRRERAPATSGWDPLMPAASSALAATAVDFAVVSALVAYLHVGAVEATAVGCLVGGLCNFTLNRWWAFSSSARPVPQALRYAIVSASSALLNSGGVALALALPLRDYRVAWVLVRAVVFLCWIFPLQRDYVYGADAVARSLARREPVARSAVES
jgi:phosphatidylglycerophosphate synthase/putative flippase GtrA